MIRFEWDGRSEVGGRSQAGQVRSVVPENAGSGKGASVRLLCDVSCQGGSQGQHDEFCLYQVLYLTVHASCPLRRDEYHRITKHHLADTSITNTHGYMPTPFYSILFHSIPLYSIPSCAANSYTAGVRDDNDMYHDVL